MAFRFILLAALVAYASAGMTMEMLQMLHEMQQNHHQPDPPAPGPCVSGNCHIPKGVDIGDYLAQQKADQKYESEQMTMKIKAQFDKVMTEVRDKKHHYAINVMSEFTQICACMEQTRGQTLYDVAFVQLARSGNVTDNMSHDTDDEPWLADSLWESKRRIFHGMLRRMCDRLKDYMSFAASVEAELVNLINV